MEAGGNTSVYQGLLKGFEIVNKGKHKIKYLFCFLMVMMLPMKRLFLN